MNVYFVILSNHKEEPINDINDAIAVMSALGLTKNQLKKLRQEDAEAGGWITPLIPDHEKTLLKQGSLHASTVIGSIDVEMP